VSNLVENKRVEVIVAQSRIPCSDIVGISHALVIKQINGEVYVDSSRKNGTVTTRPKISIQFRSLLVAQLIIAQSFLACFL
jgi:hypothetical protein